MTYKNWTYSSDYEHDDGDVRKLEHYATHTDGRVINLDFSPYNNRVKNISLEAMVELDFPGRCDMVCSRGPINEVELLEMYISHLKRKHEEQGNTTWLTQLKQKLLTIPNTKPNPVTT